MKILYRCKIWLGVQTEDGPDPLTQTYVALCVTEGRPYGITK